MKRWTYLKIICKILFITLFCYGCKNEVKPKFACVDVIYNDITYSSINESFDISKSFELIDSIFAYVTKDYSFIKNRRKIYKELNENQELSFNHFSLNTAIPDSFVLLSNNKKYQIQCLNLNSKEYTLVVYFNEEFDEIVLVKIHKDKIWSKLYIRNDYQKNRTIFELTNTIIFSKRFVLYKLYNYQDNNHIPKFTYP